VGGPPLLSDVKVLRVATGVLVLVLALPLLVGGGGLWTLMRHRSPDGSFTATVEQTTTPGYAVVVPDIDALLRRQAAVAKGGETTLRITARVATGPAFIGLGPSANVARYLAGVPYAQVDEVRLTRGPLPVRTSTVPGGPSALAAPAAQDFWRHASATGTLTVTPSELRGQRLALVLMSPAATPALTLDVTAALTPRWLTSAAWGLLILGAVLLLAGIAVLTWPAKPREIVYVVNPAPTSTLDSPDPWAGSAGSGAAHGEPAANGDEPPAPGGGLADGDVPAPGASWPSDSPPPATPILAWPPPPPGRHAQVATPAPLPVPDPPPPTAMP
jgi:hypothetical protein